MTKTAFKRWVRSPGFWGFLFITPWLLGFLIFSVGPMLVSFWLSFHKDDLATTSYVGVENYRRLFLKDPLFWIAIRNTLEYALVAVPLGIAGSLGIAMLLNQRVKGIAVYRAFFYLPTMVPAVASALLWKWVFDADHGILNVILHTFGFGKPQWLQDDHWTMPAFILMSLWGVGGARMVIFLAGLQSISETYYEAARLDGAQAWQQFRYVTLPLLSPVMFFNLILGSIGAFQVFTSAYIMTGGGPNHGSLFYALYLYQNAFEYFKLGKASAMAWILFVILLGLTLFQFRVSRRWVHYEGEAR